MHGFESVVGPVKGVFDKETSLNKAREHSLLRSDRPAYVTILSLGRWDCCFSRQLCSSRPPPLHRTAVGSAQLQEALMFGKGRPTPRGLSGIHVSFLKSALQFIQELIVPKPAK